MLRLLLEVRWSRRLLLQALAVTVGLALLFAAVGFAELATGRLLVSNEKVLAANDLKPYFRVNSLFFDPNVYGRFLALVMVVLAGVLLWTPARRDIGRVAVVLAVLWAALVLTLSESSFAALLLGLVVLAALRWRTGRVAVAGAAGLIPAGGGGGGGRGGAHPGGGGGGGRARGDRAQDALLLPGQRGLQRPRKAGPRGTRDGQGPAAHGLRVRVLRRPLPRPRARGVVAPVGRVAHHPGNDRGGAGRYRAHGLRLPPVERVRG